ncbi:DUF4157 domain-containing protein [Streptomyces sp. NPDC057638]|uniref:eCIS core domain-containing protein n=1 Tax=Streptomyces sp. NPDC057638 TaxID=3346190 RepID=UPI00369DAADB
MRANGGTRSTEAERTRSSARTPADPPTTRLPPLLTLQGGPGNAAVVQLLRRAGHPGAQDGHEPGTDGGTGGGRTVRRSSVPDVLRSPGRPLDHRTRTEMETRLGADFSGVRVHADTAARTSAAEVGARAYTSGSHVVLGAGGADRHTLAHELVHVVQQRRGPVSGSDTGHGFRVSDPSDRFEREADTVAAGALARPLPATAPPPGRPSPAPDRPGSARVQRAPAPGEKRERSNTMQAESSDSKRVKPEQAEQAEQADTEMAGAGGGTAASTQAMDIDSDEFPSDLFYDENNVQDLLDAGLITPRDAVLSQYAFVDALEAEIAASGTWTVETTAGGARFARTKTQEHPRPNVIKKSEEVRALESISNVARSYLGDRNEEVQTAIGDDGHLLMSANRQFSIGTLQEELGSEGENIEPFLKNADVADWQKMYQWKARKFLKAIKAEGDPYAKIKSAIAKGVRVVTAGGNERHAELRILEHNGKKTPDYIAGTKRPCANCFVQLYPEGSDTVRPGFIWLSPRALDGVPQYQNRYGVEKDQAKDFFKKIGKLISRTHQAKDRAGRNVPGGRVTDWSGTELSSTDSEG